MFDGAAYERIAPLLAEHGWHQGFFLQHYRDAHVAEFAGRGTGAASLAMALAGLHLAVECRLDGRAVQLAHARLARRSIPTFSWHHTSIDPGVDKVAANPKAETFARWLKAVWAAYRDQHVAVRSWTGSALDVG